MTTHSACDTATPNPYESPIATPTMLRRRMAAQVMDWLRILALVVFALATLGGLYRWVLLQLAFGAMSGRLSVDSLPHPPLWLLWLLASLVLGTPLAILLLMLVCRRISLPLWIVIAPLLLFDIWISLTPIGRFLSDHGWKWPTHSGFTHTVSIYTGVAMVPVTAVAFVALLIICQKVPRRLWFLIVPAFALDFWFIWGWLDLQ